MLSAFSGVSTLSFSQLGCLKGGRSLFKHLDVELTSGQWLDVSGVNGAGKTSLLRMVCGLSAIEWGAILWNGQSIHAHGGTYRQNLFYLGHLNALQESMTVDDNLTFQAALRGLAIDVTYKNTVLARFGLSGRCHHLVRHLSQGQKRRVALTQLAFCTAQLWVLDEPDVALDEEGIGLLTRLMADHLRCGGLAVMASHRRISLDPIPAQLLELK